MSSDIWTQCADHKRVELNQTVYRSISSKAANTTRKHVDTDEEHEVLERLLDDSKPPYPDGPHDYVLKSPFRYRADSRFGKGDRIFYASLTEEGCFNERGYYLFRFSKSSAGLIGRRFNPFITVFTVQAHDGKAVDLTSPPFDAFRHQIASPTSYRDSRRLGKGMKEGGVRSFLFPSARGRDDVHVGIFDLFVIKSHEPENEMIYRAHVEGDTVTLFPHGSKGKKHTFRLEDYLLGGELPIPS